MASGGFRFIKPIIVLSLSRKFFLVMMILMNKINITLLWELLFNDDIMLDIYMFDMISRLLLLS